ncbi:MAG: PQQ-binding-like beta-propeller repeat protein [Prolixibacteraceae bacterium]
MRIKGIILVFLFALSFSTFAQTPTAWRGGTNGIYPDKDLLKTWPESGPELLWSFEGLGEGHSSPVFALGHIFVSSMTDKDGYITILTLDGKELKKYKYGEEFFESFPGSRSTPVIDGDWLYMYSGKGVLYAFDALAGTLHWKKELLKETDGENIKWGVTETPLVDGDLIFCSPGGKVKNIVAINRLTGNTVWTSSGTGDLSAYCSPMMVNLNDKKILVTMMADHIIGLDAKNGKLLWSYEQTNQWSVHANTPIFADQALFCTSGYGKGTVRLNLSDDGSSVTKAWFNDDLDNRIGGVVYIDGYLYASGDKNRGLHCIDAKTGEQKWENKEIGNGVVISADGLLFIYTDRGELKLAQASPTEININGTTKIEKGSAQHWAHPAIVNGILYLRHGQALMAYKIK